MYKFGWFNHGEQEQRYEYGNIWAREKTSGPDRLIIAPASQQVRLIEKLTVALSGPFGLLYVLVVSRIDARTGRYESYDELERNELQDFLTDYTSYLENDGRHHLWIFSREDNGLLVYDNHNVIYAYGPLDAFTQILEFEGLIRAEEILFPCPHHHKYNPEFDADERRILQSIPWILKPLQNGDDRPVP